MMLRIKRVYDPPSRDDGTRILVDRLWPRGLRKENARIDEWEKDLAPSSALRKWFSHDPSRWHEFQKRFFAELNTKDFEVKQLMNRARKGTVTLLYSSKEGSFNNAVALKMYLEKRNRRSTEKKAA